MNDNEQLSGVTAAQVAIFCKDQASARGRALADALAADNDFHTPDTRRSVIEAARAIREDDPTLDADINLAHQVRKFLGAESRYVDLTVQDAARLVLVHVEGGLLTERELFESFLLAPFIATPLSGVSSLYKDRRAYKHRSAEAFIVQNYPSDCGPCLGDPEDFIALLRENHHRLDEIASDLESLGKTLALLAGAYQDLRAQAEIASCPDTDDGGRYEAFERARDNGDPCYVLPAQPDA